MNDMRIRADGCLACEDSRSADCALPPSLNKAYTDRAVRREQGKRANNWNCSLDKSCVPKPRFKSACVGRMVLEGFVPFIYL
jgi:hypothetical protein